MGVRITPAAVDLATAVESQAGHKAAVETAAAVGAAETAARVAEVSRVGELEAAAVAARPRSLGGGHAGCARATSVTSVASPDCPKQVCQGCGERGHYITKCGKMENAGMAVDMLGRTSTDDDSTVCSEADFEAYATLEITTGECLVSMMEEGIYGRWGRSVAS